MAELDLDAIQPITGAPPAPLAATDDAPPDQDASPNAALNASTGARKTDSSENILVQEEAKTLSANRALRNVYADKAYRLACGCICFWVIAIGAVGVVHAVTGVQALSDAVMIAITTGVTVNVLAAFLGVIRGLFPASERGSGKNGKSADT